jgi:hypothetical protein
VLLPVRADRQLAAVNATMPLFGGAAAAVHTAIIAGAGASAGCAVVS